MHGYGGQNGMRSDSSGPGSQGPDGCGPARTGPHRARRAVLKVLAGVSIVVLVMAGITLLLGGGVQGTLSLIHQKGEQEALTVLPTPLGATVGPEQPPESTVSRSSTPSVSPTGTTRAPSARTSTRPRRASRSGTSAAATSARRGTTSPTTSEQVSDLGEQLLANLNEFRAAAGVSPLALRAGLVRSASTHDSVMAGGCGLSHQCPGEEDLGSRISTEGVKWSAVGENIGYGGPVDASDSAILAMARRMTASMMAETPPNDGHRRNILSPSFRYVGIALLRDSNGTVWMTQDFAG